MSGKRDSAYYEDRLRRDYPLIHAQLRAGRLKSVRAAAIAAGLIRQPTTLDALKRAWKNASASERRDFLRGLRAGPKRSRSKARTGADLVDVRGCFTSDTSTELRDAMGRRGLKMGELMTELGLKTLNASIATAIHGGVKLNPDTLNRLAAWLDDQRS